MHWSISLTSNHLVREGERERYRHGQRGWFILSLAYEPDWKWKSWKISHIKTLKPLPMAVIALSLLLIPVQTTVMAWSRLLFLFSWSVNCQDISVMPLGVSGNDKTLLLGKQRIWTQWIGSPVFWLPARQRTTMRSSSRHFSLPKPSSIASREACLDSTVIYTKYPQT